MLLPPPSEAAPTPNLSESIHYRTIMNWFRRVGGGKGSWWIEHPRFKRTNVPTNNTLWSGYIYPDRAGFAITQI